MNELERKIRERLARDEPEVEVLRVTWPAKATVRIYIDHPEGVDHTLCERVTRHLWDLLESWSLEVSSPGID